MDKIGEGVGIFIRGLAKKVLLANNIGMLWTTVKALPQGEISVLTAWLGILALDVYKRQSFPSAQSAIIWISPDLSCSVMWN